ncbi:MAG: hypothetical protein Q9187_002525 [Circinaria calcarea]
MVISIIRFAVVMRFSAQPEQTWLYFWNTIENTIAIIIICLASFRALFTKQNQRVKVPDYTKESRKRILYGTRSIKGRGILALWNSSWRFRSTIPKTTEKSGGPKVSQEHIIPPNRVYVRNEFEMSSYARPRELGV